jgi:hypothetical protein
VDLSDIDIARWRLRTQALVGERLTGAADVVGSLLGVQAENPQQSAWAVAARTTSPDARDLAGLLADGRVIRTHVLRPTWHYVTAEDLVWLLELTAPRVRATTRQQLRRTHGLDDRAVDELTTAVLDLLDGRELTRPQLAEALAADGRELTGQALMILLADLELQALVCSGAPVDGVHAYARLADRVTVPRRLERDEALAEITLRYVTGHGPATERDLAYWATLTLTDVRAGLAAARDRLESFVHDDRTFWHAPGEEPPTGRQQPAAHLLQLLDETYRGYQDSRMVLDAAGAVPRGREAAIGMCLVDGQLVASMKRSTTDHRVVFDLVPHASWSPASTHAVDDAAAAYGAFLGLEPEVRVASR